MDEKNVTLSVPAEADFARSVRMRHYMSPDNPYTTANGLPYVERALFGQGMRG